MLKYLLLFIFCGMNLLGQDPDTLLTTILRIENDTECVNQLYDQGYDLIDKNPKLAYVYAQNCEKIALKSKSIWHISRSYNLLGILFYKQGNFKKAKAYFEQHLSTSKALNNQLGIAFSLTNLGHIHLQLKQYDYAEKNYLMALEYHNILHNKTEVANGLINLGVVKHEQKQLEAAYENYEKALQTGKELNNYEIKAISLNNLAQVFLDKGEYEKAMAYNYDALELRELMGLEVDMVDSYLSIADIALKQKNPELALENLNLALGLCNKHEYSEGKMTYHKLASELYSQQNNYQVAYQHLKTYTQLNDSLMLMQNIDSYYEFNEAFSQPIEDDTYDGSIKNKFFMVVLLILIIFISFIIFKNKR